MKKTLMGIFSICLASVCFLFVGCFNNTNLKIEDLISKYSNDYNYTADSYTNGDSGMIAELEASITTDDQETDYVQLYVFENNQDAQAYLDKNSATFKLIQDSKSTMGISVTFGVYINVVYIATSTTLNILKS